MLASRVKCDGLRRKFRAKSASILALALICFAPGSYGQSGPLRYVPSTPCRAVDTRQSTGKNGFSGSRDFPITGICGVPANASAYSLNVSIIPRESHLDFITVWPTGQSQPNVSLMNSFDGRVKATATIMPAGTNGNISAYLTNRGDVFIDINGYFVPEAQSGSLAFYTLPPCRAVDTRPDTGRTGLVANQVYPFAIAGNCGVPAAATAYLLNFTAIPRESTLDFLNAWPSGQTMPGTSILNAFTGAVTANSAIVPGARRQHRCARYQESRRAD